MKKFRGEFEAAIETAREDAPPPLAATDQVATLGVSA